MGTVGHQITEIYCFLMGNLQCAAGKKKYLKTQFCITLTLYHGMSQPSFGNAGSA